MLKERIINRTHKITSDSLKAYMVAPFADMPREEITLAQSHYPSRIQHFTKAEEGFIKKFFILFYILFSCDTKNKMIT